jgi:hypothetical protein
MKNLPPTITEPFSQDENKRMLMTSPTHVFSFLPGQPLFKEGWQDAGFTYTWVRDHILLPRQKFYEAITLSPEEQHLLLQKLNLDARSSAPLTIPEFRAQFPPSAEIDAQLFELLPLTTPDQAKGLCHFFGAPQLTRALFRQELHEWLVSVNLSSQEDIHQLVAQKMEEKGLSPPRALLFADTNWPELYFSFAIDPATNQLQLYRTDRLGLTGTPMLDWAPYFAGMGKQSWSLFTQPYQYRLFAI